MNRRSMCLDGAVSLLQLLLRSLQCSHVFGENLRALSLFLQGVVFHFSMCTF